MRRRTFQVCDVNSSPQYRSFCVPMLKSFTKLTKHNKDQQSQNEICLWFSRLKCPRLLIVRGWLTPLFTNSGLIVASYPPFVQEYHWSELSLVIRLADYDFGFGRSIWLVGRETSPFAGSFWIGWSEGWICGGISGTGKTCYHHFNCKSCLSLQHNAAQGPASSTRVRFCFKTDIFFLRFWPTVHTYPIKTVTENGSFQKSSSE